VKVYANGRIEGTGRCQEFRAGQAAQDVPVGQRPIGKVGAEASGAFVRLGGFNHFLETRGFNRLLNKFKEFDDVLRNRFISDFGSNIEALTKLNTNPHFLDAGTALGNKPVLRVETNFLETYSDFQIGRASLSFQAHGCSHLDEAFIRHYTGEAYASLNAFTEGYGAGTVSPFLNEFRQGLESALRMLPNDPIQVLHRGLGRIESSNVRRDWRQGQIITSNKFWSTSKSNRVANSFREINNGDVILSIRHRTGKYVESITKYRGEEECLITLGKQFSVDSITDIDGIRFINLTEL
jgi:hypothetical protein